jgi:hypothetical protein
MKALDMLRRLATLLEQRRVSEEEVHAIFNGTTVSFTGGVGTYKNGNVVIGGAVRNLSADRINDVVWPKPVPLPQAKGPAPGLTMKKPETFRSGAPKTQPKGFDSES